MITTNISVLCLEATGKKQAFQKIAEHAVQHFHAPPDILVEQLLERERIGTTGIGNGVAIPHIKVEGLDSMQGVLAVLDSAVDFDAIDDRPVDIMFAFFAPANSKTTQHLKVLAQISRFLKDEDVCRALRRQHTPENTKNVLDNWQARQAAA